VKKRTRKRKDEEHTHLAIRVDGHDIRSGVSINLNLITHRPFNVDRDDPVFDASSSVRMWGTVTHPAERAGHRFEVDVHGDGKTSRKKLTLKDIHAQDAKNVPIYKEYRGVQYPVYDPPPGLGTIQPARGDQPWRCWIFAEPTVVSDMLATLAQPRTLYLAIHELKIGRERWARGITLQTCDPTED
jgi:hypothetical protein